MKALVELKTDKKLEDIAIANAGTEKYDLIVNEILKNVKFEIVDVQAFDGYPEVEKEYSSLEIPEATYISTVIELQNDEIENFKSYENQIIDKAIHSLTSRELDIMGASEYGKETFLFFHRE